jgi:hypothetical protein
VKWWLIGTTLSVILVWLFYLLVMISSGRSFGTFIERQESMLGGFALFYPFFGLFTISMARRYMMYVTAAERVFSAFGWEDPGNIDLPLRTKEQRKPGDPAELGIFYFKY